MSNQESGNHRLPRHPQFFLEAPYSSQATLEWGVLSVLFSFGRPIAFDYLDGAKMISGLPRFSMKHVYNWRDFRSIQTLSGKEFDSLLLDALTKESQSLRSGDMAYEDTDLDQQPSKDEDVADLNSEVNPELEEEEEEYFDLDDEDDDYEDEDDDDEDDDDYDDDDDNDIDYDEDLIDLDDDDEGVNN